jgi:hypothetical protein
LPPNLALADRGRVSSFAPGRAHFASGRVAVCRAGVVPVRIAFPDLGMIVREVVILPLTKSVYLPRLPLANVAFQDTNDSEDITFRACRTAAHRVVAAGFLRVVQPIQRPQRAKQDSDESWRALHRCLSFRDPRLGEPSSDRLDRSLSVPARVPCKSDIRPFSLACSSSNFFTSWACLASLASVSAA